MDRFAATYDQQENKESKHSSLDDDLSGFAQPSLRSLNSAFGEPSNFNEEVFRSIPVGAAQEEQPLWRSMATGDDQPVWRGTAFEDDSMAPPGLARHFAGFDDEHGDAGSDPFAQPSLAASKNALFANLDAQSVFSLKSQAAEPVTPVANWSTVEVPQAPAYLEPHYTLFLARPLHTERNGLAMLIQTITSVLIVAHVDVHADPERCRLQCATYPSGHRIPFNVNVFRTSASRAAAAAEGAQKPSQPKQESEVSVVEFQKRNGCSVAFAGVFRNVATKLAEIGVLMHAPGNESARAVPPPAMAESADSRTAAGAVTETVAHLVQMAQSDMSDVRSQALSTLADLTTQQSAVYCPAVAGCSEALQMLCDLLAGPSDDAARAALAVLANCTTASSAKSPACAAVVAHVSQQLEAFGTRLGGLCSAAASASKHNTSVTTGTVSVNSPATPASPAPCARVAIVREAARLLANLAENLGNSQEAHALATTAAPATLDALRTTTCPQARLHGARLEKHAAVAQLQHLSRKHVPTAGHESHAVGKVAQLKLSPNLAHTGADQ